MRNSDWSSDVCSSDLVSRRIVELMREVDDYHPYIRGLIASFVFDQIGIPYDRQARTSGESKFKFTRLLGLAVDGILLHRTEESRVGKDGVSPCSARWSLNN